MKKLTSVNPKNPHYTEISEKMYEAAQELEMDDEQLFHFFRQYSPTKRAITKSTYIFMALENRANKAKTSEANPSAWMFRNFYPTASTYECGYYRHPGEWEQKQHQDGSRYWENQVGEQPCYENAESYEASMAE